MHLVIVVLKCNRILSLEVLRSLGKNSDPQEKFPLVKWSRATVLNYQVLYVRECVIMGACVCLCVCVCVCVLCVHVCVCVCDQV